MRSIVRDSGSQTVLVSELQRELNRSRPTHLIEGTETTIYSPRAQTSTKHILGQTKIRAATGHQLAWFGKVWVIEDVEKVGPELQLNALAKTELTAQGEICLKEWKSA